MKSPSATHVVIIPSFNPGPRVYETVRSAREHWSPVWVVVDGSTDGSIEKLEAMASSDPELRIFTLPKNMGKGSAVLLGLEKAAAMNFTHALTLDSDGQHPTALIPTFMAESNRKLDHMVLGLPIFDASAPNIRIQGRKISNWWTNFETLWDGIGDSLFGFRVYPVVPLLKIMHTHRWMRRFDFDAEAAVRLSWQGIRPLNIAVPVRYFKASDGGVSHFRYVRDNILLISMHVRLVLGCVIRLPVLLIRKLKR
jgi:glycosyltransferase involved in cell wall biosynthesis